MYKLFLGLLALLLLAAMPAAAQDYVVAGPAAFGQDTEEDCPTDREMNRAVGGFNLVDIDDVPWEACAAIMQAVPDHVFQGVVFPLDYIITYTTSDGTVVVTLGDGLEHDIMGATFRYLPAYLGNEDYEWATNYARLYAGEVRYGLLDDGEARDPMFIVEADDSLGFNQDVCPQTPREVAVAIGGNAADWTAPNWQGGGWVYDGPEVLLSVPAHLPNWIDFENEAVWGGDSVHAEEATYHCHVFLA